LWLPEISSGFRCQIQTWLVFLFQGLSAWISLKESHLNLELEEDFFFSVQVILLILE
jgi:hypothetical protein